MINYFKKRKLSKTDITKLCEIKDYFCITTVANHSLIKTDLLKAIGYESDLSVKVNDDLDSISSTDYFTNFSGSYYKDLFLNEVVNKHYQRTVNSLGFDMYEVHNVWYQQYNKNDTHAWHNHPGSTYSNVYFLELPKKEVATEFKNVLTNNTFTINGVREGDILSFPGHFIHRSPKNNTDCRKSVIVFNTDVYS